MDYQPRKQKWETVKPPRKYSIKELFLADGTVIGIFEGSRGAIPEHDILIKYQEKGRRVRTPKHIHWVIDLLIKKEHNKELTLEFMRYLRKMYDRVEAFRSKEDRKNFLPKETAKEKVTYSPSKREEPLVSSTELPAPSPQALIRLCPSLFL